MMWINEDLATAEAAAAIVAAASVLSVDGYVADADDNTEIPGLPAGGGRCLSLIHI